MSTNTTTANSRYDCEEPSVEQLKELVVTQAERIDELEERIDEIEDDDEQPGDGNKRIYKLEEQIDELATSVGEQLEDGDKRITEVEEEIDELTNTVDEQPDFEIEDGSDPIGSLTVDGAPLGRAIQSKASKTDVEQVIESVGSSSQTDETTRQEPDTTPIEQLSLADDVTDVTDSVSVERAVSLFRNLPKWGKKTPKGICLRPKDNPLQLLETDRNESLAWKQYYRAAKVLERLSKGAVTFFDSDRHGKMIVLHEQSDVYERLTNGTLTLSSARQTT